MTRYVHESRHHTSSLTDRIAAAVLAPRPTVLIYLHGNALSTPVVIKSRIDKNLSYHRQTAQRSVLLKMLLSHWRSLSHLKLHRCLGCACKFLLAFHRYCSMLFIARTMPSEDVSLSVCLSHVSILSKRLNISSKFFSPSGSQTILVFPYQR